jgi:hypothetical protein
LRESKKLCQGEEKTICKTNFLEYCTLPAIIGERLFYKFDSGKDQINKLSFMKNIVNIYVSDIDTRMKYTFDM